MDASAIAIGLGGLIQPYLQQWLQGEKISGKKAVLVTTLLSMLIALLGIWLTGGLAGTKVPAFSLLDPSPLLGFLAAKWAGVYAISSLVFHLAPEGVNAQKMSDPSQP